MRRGFSAAAVCIGILASCIPTGYAVQQEVSWTIDENETIRHIDREMYGTNCEWSAGEESFGNWVVRDKDGTCGLPANFAEAWKDTLPFARMAGSSANEFRWKDAIGPMNKRANQKMWGYQNGPVYSGIVEWLTALYSVTPDAQIIYTVNMSSDSVENIADLVEFMTGDGSINYNGGENWAEVRKSLGLEQPVKIFAWELGNELDWTKNWPLDNYIAYCKKVIPIIRAIDPDAKIMAFASTAAHADGEGADGTRWENWHRPVLEELGDKIDYLAMHYYYPAGYVRRADAVFDRLESDIREITGSDRIKLVIDEQAPAPNSYSYDEENTYDYCLPHTIWGSTALAEFYMRMALRPQVVATNDHSVDSSVWTIVYTDSDGNKQRSGTGEVINTFVRFGVGDLLKSELDTFAKDKSSSIAGEAVRDKDGNINLLFTNRNDSDTVNVKFNFKNGIYRVKYVRKIHGSVRSADNWYRKGWKYSNPDKISVEEQAAESEYALASYSFEPLSVYALVLEPVGGAENAAVSQ